MMTVQQAVQRTAEHLQAGRVAEAEQLAREIVRQVPTAPAGWNILGVALAAVGKWAEADGAYREAIRLAPESVEAWSNWGLLQRTLGRLGEAVESLERAATLAPEHPGVACNFATALLEVGRVPDALAVARRGLALAPDFAALHTGLILMLHYAPATTSEEIIAELARWNARFAEPQRGQWQSHRNESTPDRRLKVGYASSDLRAHSVARFLLPLLAAHDPAAVEAVCYADVAVPDGMTLQLQKAAHGWRSIVGMSDDAVADLVRADGVDILVDLSMHTNGNRLLVFARKPAPVQVTWLAYASSTGLPAIDYRLSDSQIDPPDATPGYVEQTLRLESFWCYQAPPEAPPVGGLPVDWCTGVTFGSQNLLAKVSDDTLAAWAQILVRVPGSRLFLHASAGSHRQRIAAALERAGVNPFRAVCNERLPLDGFLKLHTSIDVGLDTFPFGGGTTTCDALWMGVPVVTLRGATSVGRGGASLLTRVGLPELVAGSVQQYVELAVQLADDRARLRALRETMRERMRRSALMDAPRFARNIEAAYRQMWRTWCAK